MGGRFVRDVVAGRQVVALSENAPVLEAAKAMKNANVGAVIVTDRGRLSGIFSERDAIQRVIAEGLDPSTVPVSQVMTVGIITVTMDTPVSRVLHIMYENNFRHVPVVDRLGAPAGMVSVRDILGDEIYGVSDPPEHPSSGIID